IQNAVTKKWHYEIDTDRADHELRIPRLLLTLGHIGFAGRAMLFFFMGFVMFKALAVQVNQTGNTMANGLNQLLSTGSGTVFMFIIGTYRHFPTPPPSGKPAIL
ncbi:hypothetical protein BDK51DRAFT_25586, partial [Blyttiomyces helicus]